nr:hypothetical protein [Tanacetum cinerariifolium]
MVNLPIYVSCIKKFWASVSVKKSNDVVKLQALIDRKKVAVIEDTIRQDLRLDDADGVECLPNEEIFTELTRLPGMNLVLLWPRLSSALPQKVFANMRRIGKGFSGVKTPLFDTMLVQPQVQDAAEVEEDKDDKKVAYLEQDKVAQALEITKLKEKVMKLERNRRSKHYGLKRLRKVGGKIAELDTDEDVTLIDVGTSVEIDVDIQRRMEKDVTAVKEVNAVEPTVFDDEEVTMTMAQTLIKIKAKKARIFDEQMAKRMQDEEIEQAAARERQEKEDLERAKVLRQQYDQKQENIDWNIIVE